MCKHDTTRGALTDKSLSTVERHGTNEIPVKGRGVHYAAVHSTQMDPNGNLASVEIANHDSPGLWSSSD